MSIYGESFITTKSSRPIRYKCANKKRTDRANLLRRSTVGSAATALFTVLSFPAHSEPAWSPHGNVLTWEEGQTVSVQTLNCADFGYTGIVVGGSVTLTVPAPDDKSPQTIKIVCPNILFRDGSQILSKEILDIKIGQQAAGPIKFVSTRGEDGASAKPSPDIWEVWKQPKANKGPDGTNGDKARVDHGSDVGQPGKKGDPGARGGDGALGNPGGGGRTASKIQVRVADFADGATLFVHAVGGDGAPGGKGGRGQDGGEGGDGGTGGKGGDGIINHPGSSGGDGGNGGDGGRGGNGGTGGAGGPGGNGADVVVFMREGSQAPEDIDLSADGGLGGAGGEGGDYGLGGKGGAGGKAGCGGSGGSFLGISTNAGGNCATDGHPGKDGEHGNKGGAWGQDGNPGYLSKVMLAKIPKAAF